MNKREKILRNQNYTMLYLSNGERLYPAATKYEFLEMLIGSEYHQDPEWEFLKGKDGKTMTEEEYLRDILFETEWTVEMLEELVVDIEELLEKDPDTICNELDNMGIQFRYGADKIVDWLSSLLTIAKKKIEERR